MITRHQRELAAFTALAALLIVTGIVAPSFFDPSNLRDLAVANAPVLIVAIGMTLVIIAGQIDISVGSQFAVCGMLAGFLARQEIPVPLLIFIAPMIGALLGGLNGALVARLGMPAIVVTLAMMVILRDSLRWITEGEWVQGMPSGFQWFGLGQGAGQIIIVAISIVILFVMRWVLNNVAAGRAVYAVGSDSEAARLSGVDPRLITFAVFAALGALTGLAALLNSIRFNSIPSNSGLGLELKAIAAVVVGGTAITGGRGSLIGTLLGVVLLGAIGTALTYLGINPFWEKAIQGGIILLALLSETLFTRVFSSQPEGAR